MLLFCKSILFFHQKKFEIFVGLRIISAFCSVLEFEQICFNLIRISNLRANSFFLIKTEVWQTFLQFYSFKREEVFYSIVYFFIANETKTIVNFINLRSPFTKWIPCSSFYQNHLNLHLLFIPPLLNSCPISKSSFLFHKIF